MPDEQLIIDPLLSVLVDSVNNLTERQDDGPGITLTVHGVVVSGKIIPAWKWLDDVQRQREELVGDQLAVFLNNVKEGAIKRRDEINIVDAVADKLPDPWRQALYKVEPTTFIHLRDARIYPAGGLSPIPGTHHDGAYWRGQLADVSGWSLGALCEADTDVQPSRDEHARVG